MRRMFLGLVVGIILIAGIGAGVRAEVKPAGAGGGFRIEQEYVLPATPNEVFDALTGDISSWWDHSFSEHPKKLYVEARPGGGFYEIFDDAGNGVLHATVIYAQRGKMLRFTGPLGLSGRAVDCVTTYELSGENQANGAAAAGTKLKLTVAMSVEVDEATAKIVDAVWHHFLGERFTAYIVSGEYKKHAAGGGAPPEMQQMSVNPLMRGKVKTDKTIRLEKMMNASPDELFQMWTTEVGVHAFFAAAAKIEPRVGGAYTIIFDPAADPNGDSLGTNGARILEFERPRKLSFEWVPFRDAARPGTSGPPAVATALRNERPIPTWVEIEFAAVPGDTMKTDVKFAHYGFKSGKEWDAAFNYSKGVWADVMDKLAKWAEMPRVASGSPQMRGAATDIAPDSPGGMVMNAVGKRVTISDFAFLGGRWVGTAGTDTVEQICTAPARGSMSCVFRSMSAEKIDGLEFTTLRETAGGLEERVRFFSPELAETAGDEGITLRVARMTDSEIIFDNAKASGVVKHVTITRRSANGFGTRIEVVYASGKSGFIVAEWKRAAIE